MAVGHEDSGPSVGVRCVSSLQCTPSADEDIQAQNTHDTDSADESRYLTSIPQIYSANLLTSQNDHNLYNITLRSNVSASNAPQITSQGKHSSRETHLSNVRKHFSRKGKSVKTSTHPIGYDGHGNSTSMSSDRDSNRRPSRSTNQSGSRSDDNPPPPYDRHSYDDDDDNSEDMGFDDKSIRRAFIRKVYLILMCMMIFASGVISFTMFHLPTKHFISTHPWLTIVAGALYLIFVLAIICCESVRRTVPYNYIILALITFALSFLAACSAANFDKIEVLAAFLITAVICLALTLFAFQTKWDFTVISGALIVASIIMLVFGLVLIFWRDRIAMIAYSCLGAALGSLYFVFHTQLILGGHHRYAISPEEYVFAAISLFTDIINIFVMTMNIIGLARGE